MVICGDVLQVVDVVKAQNQCVVEPTAAGGYISCAGPQSKYQNVSTGGLNSEVVTKISGAVE